MTDESDIYRKLYENKYWDRIFELWHKDVIFYDKCIDYIDSIIPGCRVVTNIPGYYKYVVNLIEQMDNPYRNKYDRRNRKI